MNLLNYEIAPSNSSNSLKWVTIALVQKPNDYVILYDTIELNITTILSHYRYLYENEFNVTKIKYLGRELKYYVDKECNFKLYISLTKYNTLSINFI